MAMNEILFMLGREMNGLVMVDRADMVLQVMFRLRSGGRVLYVMVFWFFHC